MSGNGRDVDDEDKAPQKRMRIQVDEADDSGQNKASGGSHSGGGGGKSTTTAPASSSNGSGSGSAIGSGTGTGTGSGSATATTTTTGSGSGSGSNGGRPRSGSSESSGSDHSRSFSPVYGGRDLWDSSPRYRPSSPDHSPCYSRTPSPENVARDHEYEHIGHLLMVLGVKMCRHLTLGNGAYSPRIMKSVAQSLIPAAWWHGSFVRSFVRFVSFELVLYHYYRRMSVVTLQHLCPSVPASPELSWQEVIFNCFL